MSGRRLGCGPRFLAQAAWHRGRGNRDTQQIRAFYEAGPGTIFITFADGTMRWCRPHGAIVRRDDGGKVRGTLDGWSDTSVGGKPLRVEGLSGHLLKVQMFRGTICQVGAADYVLRKLNDEVLPVVAAAQQAEHEHQKALVPLMRLLTWQDFELLVDLVFSSAGWRRVNVVGGTQKTVDLELVLPTTGERAFVQIKSEANTSALRDYAGRFATSVHDRMFFVWHSGAVDGTGLDDDITLIGPERLASMVLDAGLSAWLREKVS